MAKFLGTNIVTTNGDAWKRQRKVANPAFHEIDTNSFNECAAILVDAIASDAKKGPVKTLSMMQRVTLDVLGKAAFGFEFNAVREPNGRFVKVHEVVVKEYARGLPKAFPYWDQYLRSEKAWKTLDEYEHLIYGIINEKKKAGLFDKDKDLLARMLKANDDKENPTLTDLELRDNMMVFILAGHDTTANCLTYVLYFMALNKKIQSRARKEALDVLGADFENITVDMQKNLDYLTACIREALRICPPIALNLPRITSEAVDVGRGIVIPKNTPVFTSTYALHHNPSNWSNPDEFDPERFLDPTAQFSAAWMPFGGGSRSCLGMAFTMIEQRIILSYLLRAFEWDLAPGVHDSGLKLKSYVSGALSPLEIELYFRPIV